MAGGLTASFQRLAQRMAQNHIYLSVRNEDYIPTLSRFLRASDSSTPPKIVAVVGAGASNDACGLPAGGDATKLLIKAFQERASVSNGLIEEEVHRITVEYRLERSDFEAVLLALSKFDQKSVLEQLNAIYNRRHHPSLTYEVLAHWLKHRFLDAIVNFNFDELLDQTIDDELGPHGYYRVITDGDCPEHLSHWLDKRGRFRFPLYIKPHGTASHKSTMRFTRTSYSLLPIDLVRLLSTLFEGSVNVLVVGHAMQSVEFNDILASSGGVGLRFYALGHGKPEFRVASRPKWSMDFVKTSPSRSLGHVIDLINSRVVDRFRDGFKPRSISRHRLISTLFGRPAVFSREVHARDRRREAYLRDRVYVEIALAIAKAKGFVILEQLACRRAGQYFRRLRRFAAPDSKDSLFQMCADLQIEPFGYSRDALCLPVMPTNPGRDRLRRPILPRAEFRKAARLLALSTRDHLSPERQSRCSPDELIAAFMDMYDGDEVEVSGEADSSSNDVFTSPTALPTLSSLHAVTSKIIGSDWDSILCTAESGEWLLNKEWSYEIKKRNATIALIVADETYDRALRRRFKDNLGDRIRWLPWWLHNKHVTVFLRHKKVQQAIFFERRVRALHIAPLWLEGADAEMAMHAFVAYWIKADQYNRFRDDMEIRPEQVRTQSEQLIRKLYLRKKR